MTKDEALKMAIEGLLELLSFVNEELEIAYRCDTNEAVKLKAKLDNVQEKINACKEALEQPQPRLFLDLSNSHGNHPVEQPAWQGLTDDEIDEITDELNISLILSCDIIDFVMAIEQALKQKNTP
jgi:hypothetical protein